MKNKPTIKVEFSLVKKDDEDFDREKISRILDITSARSNPPRMSGGKIYCENSNAINGGYYGLSIVQSPKLPFNMIIHACWQFEILVETCSLESALEEMKKHICGKEELIKSVCNEYNLKQEFICRVYVKDGFLPELYISQENINYMNYLEVSLNLDLQFD